MKSVLISIQPKWCELIASGKKTVEVRKTKPKLETPFKCYIYETKGYDTLFGNGSPKKLCVSGGYVIGEFVCNCMTGLKADNMVQAYYNNTKDTCLTDEEIKRYANGKKLYYWHISDLVVYDKPKELGEFYTVVEDADCGMCRYYDTPYDREPCNQCQGGRKYLERPPQSWCYVEERSRL